MTDMFLLSEAQMARISPFFPLSHGMPRVDDRRVISGIIFVIRNGLRWRDVPASYGPHKTIYNRFIRWSEMGVFGRIFVELGLCCTNAVRDSCCESSVIAGGHEQTERNHLHDCELARIQQGAQAPRVAGDLV
jgi:transposase